ncbi:hypothetical protein WJX75_003730 [Coccomyxa subellipsoidea]|uniref:Uncharacterized protein n=1 Tax=Coccomyxa subellipsoidea TaxID=248742 RepID=A0ABR2YEU6_9CHLO
MDEGADDLTESTSALKEEVGNFLLNTLAYGDEAGNVPGLQGSERQQLKDQLNEAYRAVVDVEDKDPAVIAQRAAQKAAADAEAAAKEKQDDIVICVGESIVLIIFLLAIILPMPGLKAGHSMCPGGTNVEMTRCAPSSAAAHGPQSEIDMGTGDKNVNVLESVE